MKLVALCSTLALIFGAVLFRVLQHDAGYVLIVIAGKTIEMRFWFAVLLVSVIVFSVIWLIRFVYRVISVLANGWSLAMANRARRGAMRTSSGFIQFIEGDWLGAKKSLLQAAKDVDEPLVHYLGAARSAYETGNFEQADTLIKKAQKIAPNNQAAIAISQARMLFLSARYDACLSVLHGVKTALPNHPVVLDLLYKSYLALKDWPSLELVLPELEKKNILSEPDLRQLQINVYQNLLYAKANFQPIPLLTSGVATDVVDTVSENSKKDPEEMSGQTLKDNLDSLWRRIPKSLKIEPEIIDLYARLLVKSNRADEAELLLRTALKKQWSEVLVHLYGLVDGIDAKSQLSTADTWLAKHPQSAVLHLALGRICLRCGLWGQAKDYFQGSIQLDASPTAYAELARLQSALGEHEVSKMSCQAGLLMAAEPLPDLPMPRL